MIVNGKVCEVYFGKNGVVHRIDFKWEGGSDWNGVNGFGDKMEGDIKITLKNGIDCEVLVGKNGRGVVNNYETIALDIESMFVQT